LVVVMVTPRVRCRGATLGRGVRVHQSSWVGDRYAQVNELRVGWAWGVWRDISGWRRSSAARAALRSTRLLLHLFRANYFCGTGARPLYTHLDIASDKQGGRAQMSQAALARNRCRSSLVLRSAARAAHGLPSAARLNLSTRQKCRTPLQICRLCTTNSHDRIQRSSSELQTSLGKSITKQGERDDRACLHFGNGSCLG